MCFIHTIVLFYHWTTSVSGEQHQIVPLSPILWLFNPFWVNIPFYAPWKYKKSVVSWCFQGVQKINSDLHWLDFSRIETTTFYNPSVLKTIDWENKPIYLRFGILNSVFSTLNWYSRSSIPQLRGNLVRGKTYLFTLVKD